MSQKKPEEPDVQPEERTDENGEEIRSRQSGIGRRLRQMYDDVVSEPVPDEFSELLDKIDRSKSKK